MRVACEGDDAGGQDAVCAVAFQIIPVIDLMGGQAVAARGGRRDEYAPVRSALCDGSEPVSVARALLSVTGSNALYVADLDAIVGRAAQTLVVRLLAGSLPDVAILLDAGFRNFGEAETWRDEPKVAPVFGSETLSEVYQLASWPGLPRPSTASRDVEPVKPWMPGTEAGHDGGGLGETTILSLDFDSRGFRGKSELLETSNLWPNSIIVMTLDRVGEDRGPDLERLHQIIVRAEGRSVIAAGGVRHMADIEQVADTGAAGVLIASALHDKRICEKEIAAFRRRRRFL